MFFSCVVLNGKAFLVEHPKENICKPWDFTSEGLIVGFFFEKIFPQTHTSFHICLCLVRIIICSHYFEIKWLLAIVNETLRFMLLFIFLKRNLVRKAWHTRGRGVEKRLILSTSCTAVQNARCIVPGWHWGGHTLCTVLVLFFLKKENIFVSRICFYLRTSKYPWFFKRITLGLGWGCQTKRSVGLKWH